MLLDSLHDLFDYFIRSLGVVSTFEDLQIFVGSCKDVVKFLRVSFVDKYIFVSRHEHHHRSRTNLLDIFCNIKTVYIVLSFLLNVRSDLAIKTGE